MLAEAVEAGLGIFAGAVPATPVPGTIAAASGGRRGPTAQQRTLLLRNAAFRPPCPAPGRPPAGWSSCGAGWGGRAGRAPGAAGVAAQVVITPGCGLAGAAADYARAALACCREAARMLPELIEEEAP